VNVDWLMTAPHPWKRAHVHGADEGRIGWRWHAVPPAYPLSTRAPNDRTPALCGLRPAHGWAADLFADEMCEHCRKAALKAGIELPDWLQRSTMAVYRERKRDERSSDN
jgi:hypothetical protein